MLDKQFKNRIAKGEPEAIVELYDQYGESLLKYLTSRVGAANAKDVLQNIFIRLLRYHKKLAKAKSLPAYVFRTARNEAIRFGGQKENRQSLKSRTLEDALLLTDESVDVSKSVENRETAQMLLGQLDDASREVVELKILSGLTFKEVAGVLGVPEQTAATKYRRAIERLRKLATVKDKQNIEKAGVESALVSDEVKSTHQDNGQ